MRISRHSMFMEIAHVVAKRSTCLRLNVGAIVVSASNRIVSIGYNGQAPGEKHCETPCAAGSCNTIHAEINALAYLTVHVYNASLYVTDSPCARCADYIVQHGRIGSVYFATPYRLQDGYRKLLEGGIHVTRVLPSGAMINMETDREAS